MRSSLKSFFVCLLVMVALACAACAAPQPQTTSEGVDTPCEVSYSTYVGDHKDLFLHPGDSIAVIAPSTLPTQEQVDATVAGLASWGYVPVQGKHVYEEQRTLQDCLDDLTWALEDPSIKAIFCVRGGYGASEVMDALDPKLIASSNKFIIGYSDITVFHSAWTSVGLPSIHSCMSVTFDGLAEPCVEAERRLIAGEIPTYTCKASDLCREGEARGVLIGGNLSTFDAVIKTAYDCSQKDEPYILFLEDVNEDIQHLHRYLTILKHLGVLDKAAGIVFGEWVDLPVYESDYFGNSRGGDFASVDDMISRQFLDGTSIPVAFGFPAGHGDTNYPLLMGERAHLSVSKDSYTLSWLAS